MKISLYTLILPRIELPFLEEWITHNLSIGVDEIFIYNNGFISIDKNSDSKRVVKDYIWSKKPKLDYSDDLSDEKIIAELNTIQSKYKGKVHIKSWVYKKDHEDEYPKSQITGFKHCVENNNSDYWLFCDPDEHFVLQKHKTFQDLINDKKYKDVGAFWFGSKLYKRRKKGIATSELKFTGQIRKAVGNWKNTKCSSKSLVKMPICWAYKRDSIIHKNRSCYGKNINLSMEIAYFKHYLLSG